MSSERSLSSAEWSLLLSLLDELREEIVHRFLDAPSRLVLSMTCQLFRNKYWKYAKCSQWTFLENCIDLGYLSLLRYASSCGCAIEYRELVIAIASRHSQIALWIINNYVPESSLGDNYDVCRVFLVKMAARNGDEALLKALQYLKVKDSVDLASIAAQSAHFDLALKLNPYLPVETFVAQAASTGDLKLALAKCKDPKCATERELTQLFIGALNGGHLTLMKSALKMGLDLTQVDFFLDLVPMKFEILSYIAQLRPEILAKSVTEVFRRVARENPSIEAFEWLMEFHLSPDKVDPSSILKTNLEWRPSFECAFDHPRDRSDCRFACINWLHERGFRWTVDNLEHCKVSFWSSMDQMKWLIENAVGGFLPGETFLLSYISSSLNCDPKYALYLFGLDNAKIGPEHLIQMLFLENNLEILETFYRELGAVRFTELCYVKNPVVSFVLSHLQRQATDIKWPKSRLRYHNLTLLLRWLVEKQLLTTSEDLIELVKKTAHHRYFNRELRSIMALMAK